MRGKGTKVGEGENNPEKNLVFLRSGLFRSGKVRGALIFHLFLLTFIAEP